VRLVVVLLLLVVTTFTTPARADPLNAFRDAYRRGDYPEALRMVRPDKVFGIVRLDAEHGDPQAQTFLGWMYFSGQGVPPDKVEGVRWYRRAAEQGDAGAQAELGLLYEYANGVPQDFAQSAIWFRRAAEQGDATSQLKMGMLYFQGKGVPKDYVASYMWFNLAAGNSFMPVSDDPIIAGIGAAIRADATKDRDLISRLMTVEQIAEGQRLSRIWKPSKWTKGSPARSPDTSDPGTSGTGFFVSKNGLVLTNAHVVEDCQHTSVGTGDKKSPVRVVARDASNDLALLASNLRSAPQGAIRASVRTGEDIVVYGYPLSSILASSGNITVGNISALSGIGDDSRYLQISAPVQPGNSGGPVLDRQGNIVGVVVGKLNALAIAATTNDIPQNVNFAIKSAVIMSFLDAQKVSTAPPNAGAPPFYRRARGASQRVHGSGRVPPLVPELSFVVGEGSRR
jgi:uncharacterized protein